VSAGPNGAAAIMSGQAAVIAISVTGQRLPRNQMPAAANQPDRPVDHRQHGAIPRYPSECRQRERQIRGRRAEHHRAHQGDVRVDWKATAKEKVFGVLVADTNKNRQRSICDVLLGSLTNRQFPQMSRSTGS